VAIEKEWMYTFSSKIFRLKLAYFIDTAQREDCAL
jgi:hypothetical protein